jgi:hypothetical protein
MPSKIIETVLPEIDEPAGSRVFPELRLILAGLISVKTQCRIALAQQTNAPERAERFRRVKSLAMLYDDNSPARHQRRGRQII